MLIIPSLIYMLIVIRLRKAKTSFFQVLLPQIPSVAQDDLKHVANEIFKSMRYGLVIHRDQDRFVQKIMVSKISNFTLV